MGYAETRERHVADWGAAMSDRLGRLRWTRDQIDAERDRALRELVTHARNASPWHGGRLRDIDVERLTADDLRELPTMTKANVVEHFDGIVTVEGVTRAACDAHLATLLDDAYLGEDLHVVASGGSSGERAVFVYGWDAWIDVHLGLGRYIIDQLDKVDLGGGACTMGLVGAHSPTHMTSSVAQTFRSDFVDVRLFPVTLPLPEIVTGLNELQPVALTAYASMLGVLAVEQRAGRLRIRPQRIIATSEPLLAEIRSAAEEVFGAPVANCWGTSEGGILAMGCWQSDGMHLNEDLVIVEPVDAAGRPVEPGERASKVLLTNLFNPTMPLIRYELTDEVVLLDEPCTCGSAHRRVADVEGRLDDIFSYRDVMVHPHVLRSVLGRCAEITEYQVRQTLDGLDVSVRVSGPLDLDDVERELVAALEGAGLTEPTVTVMPVDRLQRHESTGKLPRFVPARPTAGAGRSR